MFPHENFWICSELTALEGIPAPREQTPRQSSRRRQALQLQHYLSFLPDQEKRKKVLS